MDGLKELFLMDVRYNNITKKMTIENLLGPKRLEYFLIENAQYKSSLNNAKRINMKKHAETDSNYFQGFFSGSPVYESYQILT